MRTSIILWSAFSGAVLGAMADAALVGVVVILGALFPIFRIEQRWAVVAAGVVLVAIPAALIVLGFLEGRLKTV